MVAVGISDLHDVENGKGRELENGRGHDQLIQQIQETEQELERLQQQLEERIQKEKECPTNGKVHTVDKWQAFKSWRTWRLPLGWMPMADLRALGIFRIYMAFLILYELLRTWHWREYWLLDTGVTPRSRLMQAGAWINAFCIYFGAGTQLAVFIVVVLHASVAVCVMIGFRTQLFTILLYILDSSFHFRTHCYQNSSSLMRRSLLFWSIFLPTGARFSVRPEYNGSLPMAILCFAWQYLEIYYIGALSKYGEEWENGTALWHALSLKTIGRLPFCNIITLFPGFCYVLTRATIYVEKFGPLLLLGPQKVRLVGIFVFLPLHIGIELFMDTGQFQEVMCCGLIAMIPPFACDYIAKFVWPFWNRLHTKKVDAGSSISLSGFLKKLFPHVGSQATNGKPSLQDLQTKKAIANGPNEPIYCCSWSCFTTFAALACLYTVWVFNCRFARSFLPCNHENDLCHQIVCPAPDRFLPQQMQLWMDQLGMYQEFRMFSPNPPNPGWWVRVAGLRRDDVVVDLWHGGQPSLHLPPLLSGDLYKPPPVMWADQRWVKYFEFASANNGQCSFLDLGAYYCRTWPTLNNVSLHGLAIVQFREFIDLQNFKLNEPDYAAIHFQWCADDSKRVIMQEGELASQPKWFMRGQYPPKNGDGLVNFHK